MFKNTRIGIGSKVVASTTDIRLRGNCLHSGTVTGETEKHFRVKFDENPDVEVWLYKFDVALIKSLKESD